MPLNPVVRAALEEGAALVISISGGKDSQAMSKLLVGLRRRHRWPGPLLAVYADLGPAEWPQSLEMCRRISRAAGIPLLVVRRPQGDLVAHIRARMETLRGTGKPYWPDAQNRFCTSDHKRAQIDVLLRRGPQGTMAFRGPAYARLYGALDDAFETWPDLVVSAVGIRAEESPARRRKQPLRVHERITTRRLRDLSPAEALARWEGQGRLGLEWFPIFQWSEAQVYACLGHSLSDRDRRLIQKGKADGRFDRRGQFYVQLRYEVRHASPP